MGMVDVNQVLGGIMAGETKTGWDATPQWSQIFGSALNQIEFLINLSSVKASQWAVGKNEKACEQEAMRRLAEGHNGTT